MKKLKIYLDTSVISAYFDQQKPVRQIITQKWFQHDIKTVLPYISALVLDEINANPDEVLREKMLYLVDSASINVLDINDDILKLARFYREAIIPREINDSIHIAAATYYKMNAVVSWNFKHIVNLKTIKAIHEINMKNGYSVIEIISIENLGGDKYGNL